ncbi:MAG: branched-chain amino acid ABC transporter permease [Firmicutes bacterium]|nr:branched-chain amino acid ABC transporter permease [Bacillota bacterium]
MKTKNRAGQEGEKTIRLVELREKNRQEVREGIRRGLPVLIGYFSASIPFGLLAKAGGISLLDTFLFSVLVFAGASQFMALNLLQAGVAAGEIILATFLVNCRHLVMSTVLAARLRENGPEKAGEKAENTREVDRSGKTEPGRLEPGRPEPERPRPERPGPGKLLTFLAAFGVTDETFALAVTGKERLTPLFLLSLEVTAYSGWLAGTITGFLLGAALPAEARAGMGIALYAMFAAILTPELKKSRSALFLAAGAGIFHTLLGRLRLFSSGWNLILAIVLTAVAGSYFYGEKKEE